MDTKSSPQLSASRRGARPDVRPPCYTENRNQPEAAAISNSTRSGTRPGRLLGISMAVVRPIGTRLLTSGSMVRTQLGEPLFLVTGSIATAPCGGGHDYSRGFGLSSINFGSNAPAQTIQTSAGKRASGSRIIAGRNTSPSDDSSATAATTRPEIIVQRGSRRDRPAVSEMPARRRPRGTMCPKPPVASAKAECARRRGHQDQAGRGTGRRRPAPENPTARQDVRPAARASC